MAGHWIVVASAEHVRRGRREGFVQACHGKAAPIRRIKPGDRVVCYSPAETFGGTDRLRAFTAIGIVQERAPYCVDMRGGFQPWRRDVTWAEASQVPIGALRETLELTAGKRNWGYWFRAGLVVVSARDFQMIADAMQARFVADDGACFAIGPTDGELAQTWST